MLHIDKWCRISAIDRTMKDVFPPLFMIRNVGNWCRVGAMRNVMSCRRHPRNHVTMAVLPRGRIVLVKRSTMLCTLKAAYQLVMPWPVSNHHVRTVIADAITDLLTVQSAMACRGPMLCRCAQLSGVIIERGQVGYHGLLPSCLRRLSAASLPCDMATDGRLFLEQTFMISCVSQ